MFADVIKHMEPLELEEAELEQPFSLDDEGQVATLGDWLEQKAPPKVLTAFHRTREPHPTIRSVRDPDEEGLKQVTIAVLRAADPAERLAVVGGGHYAPDDLVREVEHGSELGHRLIHAVKNHALFVEQAVRRGKIRPKPVGEELEFPDFPF